ncbi:MAG: homoaconitate hydratase family protein [Betaproteobacteria bacterium]|nr:homoaconitate hydratase family protein [Betaproteobacteria bacterium]
MRQTISEKILSRAAGRMVCAGDVIEPVPDLVVVHDWYAATVGRVLEDHGIERLAEPGKVVFVTDHEPVAVSPEAALRQRKVRDFARKYAIGHFFDVGRGGHGHVFPVEIGLILPGMYVAAYDTHVPNYGAVGALGIPFLTEIADVLAFGSVWLRVPQTVHVIISGKMNPWVSVRDVAQKLISDLDPEIVDYATVEFSGEGLRNLPFDARFTLCNTPLEIGAKSAIVAPDEITRAYLAARGVHDPNLVRSDPDATFVLEVRCDLADVPPQIALPPRPDRVAPITDALGIPVHHAFIGSCASGLLTDLRSAAAVLRGRKIASGVRMFITPATYGIYAEASAEGLLQIFSDAGAIVTAPGCGPCAAGRIAPLAPGETSINTGTRNDPGRLGPSDAQIYLASPASVACSAVAGRITDPREMMGNS